jgi:hypothetical protein
VIARSRLSVIPLWRPIEAQVIDGIHDKKISDPENASAQLTPLDILDSDQDKGQLMVNTFLSDEVIVLPNAMKSYVSPSISVNQKCEPAGGSEMCESEISNTVSTVSPAGKRIRCGTITNAAQINNSGCKENFEDSIAMTTDSSNAVTVEWAKPEASSHH